MMRAITMFVGLGGLLGLLCSAPLFAAPMYWDTSSTSGLQAGNGTWDSNTTATWSDNSGGSNPLRTWTSSADDAVFQTNGTSLVTVSGTNVGANSLIFDGTGHTIGSQRITVGAGGIVANESATMYGVTLGASQSVTVADGKTLALQSETAIGSGVAWVKDGAGTLTVSNSSPAPNNHALFVQSGGTYTHKEGTLNATATYPIRIEGTGVITQEGGTITATGYSVLGRGSGTATYNMQGGTLSFRDLYAGWGRPAVINQSGGTVTVSASFRIADSVSGTGNQYNLSDGSLTVTGAAGIGYRDHAEFNQSGGTASFGNLYLGGGGSNPAVALNRVATYALADGQLDVNTSLWVGRDYGFTGALDVNGGTITANADVNLGNVTANNGGATGVVTQTGGQVTINAANALSFRAAGTHAATYNLNGGTLTLAAINYTDTSTQQFHFGGGTLQANGDLNTTMPMTINAGGATIDTQANNVTLGGALGGNGMLTKTGAGALTLREGTIGSLNFAQGELIKDGAGTLVISSGGMALGAGRTYTHKDGTLNNAYFIHAMRVAGGATVAQQGGTINATGYVVLGEGSGTAVYEMTGGVLKVTSGGIYAGWGRQGAFNQSGGTVTLSQLSVSRDPGSGGSQYNLSGTGTLTVSGTGSVGYRSDANFNQTGGTASFGYLNIGGEGTNPNGDTAGYTLTEGQLTINNALRVGNDYGFTGNLNVEGGTLIANGDVYLGNVTANNDGAAGIVTQTGGTVTIAAGSALSFRAAGTHAAAYNLNGGTLTLAAINYTDTSTQQFHFGGGTLQANGNLNTTMPMTINAGGATIDTQANNATLGGALGGAGGLTKLGGGTLILSGANTYGGGTTVSAGILQGDTTSLRGNILNNATVVFDQTNGGTYQGVLSGDGDLVKLGEGSLGLTGNNTYAGGTTVAGGFLQINSDARLGAVPATPTVNFTLDGGGLKNVSYAVVLDANRTILLGDGGGWFTPGWSQSIALNGQVTGVGDLTANNDNGWVILANPANDYSGNTVIGGTLPGAAYNNARMRLDASEVIPHGLGNGDLVFNASAGGTARLDLSGHTETVNSLTSIGPGASVIDNSTGNGTLRVAGGNFPGIIQNTGGTLALEKLGDGTLTLTGANTYAGGTTVAGGTLMVNNTTGSGIGIGPVSVRPGAVLGGTGSIEGTVTIEADGTLATGQSVGRLTFGEDLTLQSGAIWDWEFINNSTVDNYDQAAGPTLVLPTEGDITLNILGLSGHQDFSIDWYDEFTVFTGDVLNFDPARFALVDTDSGWARGWQVSLGNSLVLTAVPEPGTLAMTLISLALLLCRRRKRQSEI